MYSRKEIIKLLKPDPEWKGFDNWIYTKKKTNLKNVLKTIHTAWDIIEDFKRPTFMELATQIKNTYPAKLPKRKMNKVIKIKNGYNDKMLKIPAFYYKDLKKHWPDDFPDNKSMPDNVYVAEDGNHRLTAYALKYLEGNISGEILVELYLGKKK